MTDTTDIAALRDQSDHGPYALVMAQNEALTKGIIVLQRQLEAERQRADNLKKPDPLVGLLRSQLKNAKAEIAALNAPVEIDATALIAEHRISIHFDEQKPNLNQPFVMRYVNCIAEGRDEGSCEPLGSDPKSALRRAISRAAMERKS